MDKLPHLIVDLDQHLPSDTAPRFPCVVCGQKGGPKGYCGRHWRPVPVAHPALISLEERRKSERITRLEAYRAACRDAVGQVSLPDPWDVEQS